MAATKEKADKRAKRKNRSKAIDDALYERLDGRNKYISIFLRILTLKAINIKKLWCMVQSN
ncbi:hypothetical protein AGMMS49921_06740 [Endomicrobiia bacterium]|nr:hypothetical protein AGMMS49921_06740 [Endomicrobiia bacterium]